MFLQFPNIFPSQTQKSTSRTYNQFKRREMKQSSCSSTTVRPHQQQLVKEKLQAALTCHANSSKASTSIIEPRITRRMTKLKHYHQSTKEKCVICLGDFSEGYGRLTCGHTFCLDCVMQWWRNHPNCPFCREEILLITTKDGKVVRFEDIPPLEKIEKDEEFIPHCELCWGEIESFEEMNICTQCRGVYWHRQCLPFKNNKWFCIECAGPEEAEVVE